MNQVDLDGVGPPLIREEIEKVIVALRDTQSEGVYELPAEMIKRLGEKAKEELIMSANLHDRRMDKRFYGSGDGSTAEKTNATECSNHRSDRTLS